MGDPKRLTSGVEGVQRLCKALVSAKYVAAAMEAWGEELVRSCPSIRQIIPNNHGSSSSNYGLKLISKRPYGREQRRRRPFPNRVVPTRTSQREPYSRSSSRNMGNW